MQMDSGVIVMDTVRANIEQIKDALEEDDDEQEEE